MPSIGWYPDPTGRCSHRWWDGQAWTSRVYAGSAVAEDGAPVTVPSGHKVFCGVCHVAAGTVEWRGRCHRCTVSLTHAYIAPKPRRELKPAELVKAAQVSFEDVLADVDRALAAGDENVALRRLDTAIAYGTVLRAVATSPKAGRAEPLTLAALMELHLQALRLHARCASFFAPEAFELTLLRRFAAMYSPEGREDLPVDAGELVAFCAARVAWIEAEYVAVNDTAAHYASSFGWPTLRVALARVGYEWEDSRRIGNGPLPVGEQGRRKAAELLGVDADGRPAAIKKAYYREAAKHHPDRLAEAPDEIRLAAEERMKEINAAYELLTA